MSERTDGGIGQAVYEVREVASELKELKRRAEQYGSASDRLRDLNAHVSTVAQSLETIGSSLNHIVARSEDLVNESAKIAAETERLAASVPGIVTRIEASDLSKGVADIKSAGDSFRLAVDEQAARLTGLLDSFGAYFTKHESRLDYLTETSHRLLERVEELCRAVGDGATVEAKTQAISAANFRKLDELQKMVREQGESLEALRKRKGLFF